MPWFFDLEAEIVPGRSAAGIEVGASGKELPAGAGMVSLRGCQRRDWRNVRVWLADGKVQQIGVRGNYRGRLQGSPVGIGSTLSQVELCIGPVIEDEEDNLVVDGSSGWSFETESWSTRGTKDPEAQVTEILVFGM